MPAFSLPKSTPARLAALLLPVLLVLAALPAPARAAPNQLARIRHAGELRVCIWPEYYGITYRNPKTRMLTGLDADLSLLLGESLGVKIRHVDSNFSALQENLASGRCDIAMHGVGITPARLAHMRFSTPYMRSDILAVTSRSNRSIQQWSDLDQPGRVIAVQAGTVMVDVMRHALKHARLLVVTPPMQRQVEVESGRADAFMSDFPFTRRLLDTTDWARVINPPTVFHPTDYAIAIASIPGDDSLVLRINAFLEQVKRDGRLRAVARKYHLEPMLIDD